MLKVQDDKWVGYSMLDGWDENYSDLALPNQWVNSSWKNDACPSFAFKGWQVWIDAEILEDRELVAQGFLDSPRFTNRTLHKFVNFNRGRNAPFSERLGDLYWEM